MSTRIVYGPGGYDPSKADGNVIHTEPDGDRTQETNRSTIETNAEQALTNLRAYVALSSPTAAQTTAAVKLLCRVAIAVIRLQLRKLDSTD